MCVHWCTAKLCSWSSALSHIYQQYVTSCQILYSFSINNIFHHKMDLRLFPNKFKIKKVRKLNISYEDIQIKQHFKVKYLECMLDETMSEEQWHFLS